MEISLELILAVIGGVGATIAAIGAARRGDEINYSKTAKAWAPAVTAMLKVKKKGEEKGSLETRESLLQVALEHTRLYRRGNKDKRLTKKYERKTKMEMEAVLDQLDHGIDAMKLIAVTGTEKVLR